MPVVVRIEGSELTAEDRETIALQAVGQKPLEEAPRPPGCIGSESGPSQTPSPEPENLLPHITTPGMQGAHHKGGYGMDEQYLSSCHKGKR